MRFIAYLDELGGNAHVISRSAHTSFKQVANAELAADPANAFIRRAISHGRSASDDPQPLRTDSCKLRNHFLCYAVAEIIVFLVSTKILKWQHSKHDSLYFSCGRGFRAFRN